MKCSRMRENFCICYSHTTMYTLPLPSAELALICYLVLLLIALFLFVFLTQGLTELFLACVIFFNCGRLTMSGFRKKKRKKERENAET